MIILLSPAKIQNFKKEHFWQNSHTPDTQIEETLKKEISTPEFLNDSTYIIKLLRKLKQEDLAELLSINHQLTQLNFDRIFQWNLPFNPENSKPAGFVYDGEVYRGLGLKEYTLEQMDAAQQKLRFLSGLYGILKPLDLIQPYRLEVSSKLTNKLGNDLYKFWTPKNSRYLESMLKSQEDDIILNLTSGEYTKAINFKKLEATVVSPEFYELKSGKLKQIVIYTKRARGLMASFAIKEGINNVDDLAAFDLEGYHFDPVNSTPLKPVFTR